MEGGISIKNNKIFFGGISVEKLSSSHKTPLYIFSEKRLLDNYNLLLSSFRKYYNNTDIFYSVKTNSEIKILKSLQISGSSAEAASELEVRQAIKAGFKGSEIILDGPSWEEDEILYCIKKNIRTFNVDSLDQMKLVSKLAKKKNVRVNVSFRIYPEINMSILSGFVENYISKFGIPLTDAIDMYEIAKKLPNININSISAHIGSMLTNPKYHKMEVEKLIHLASELNNRGFKIEEINIGGGFGVQSLNYYSLQSAIFEKAGVTKYHNAPPIETFAKEIAGTFNDCVDKYDLKSIKLILEPGRFIVSDAGILLTKVVSVKDNGWIFIDGGINLIPESIFFIRRGFLVDNKTTKIKTYNIAGPTLNTVDVLAVKQKLPKVTPGDIIVVLDSGAYSLSRSNQFTRLRPKAVYISKNKKIVLLRNKEKIDDYLNKLLS